MRSILAGVIFGLCLATAPAVAATLDISISKVAHPQLPLGVAVVELEGPIVEGDELRLERLFRRYPQFATVDSGGLPVLSMNSDGGDYEEALRIIRYVKDSGITTYVGSGHTCLSACAFIFMAGTRHQIESDDVTSRYLDVRGQLGFHAPYVSSGTSDFGSGVAAIAELFEALGPLDADLYYNLLITPPERFLYADTVDHVGRWKISLSGYAPLTITGPFLWDACVNSWNWTQAAEGEPYASSVEQQRTGETDLSLKAWLKRTADKNSTRPFTVAQFQAKPHFSGYLVDIMTDELNAEGCSLAELSSPGLPDVFGRRTGTFGPGRVPLSDIADAIDWDVVPAWYGLPPNTPISSLLPGTDVQAFSFVIDRSLEWYEALHP